MFFDWKLTDRFPAKSLPYPIHPIPGLPAKTISPKFGVVFEDTIPQSTDNQRSAYQPARVLRFVGYCRLKNIIVICRHAWEHKMATYSLEVVQSGCASRLGKPLTTNSLHAFSQKHERFPSNCRISWHRDYTY